MGSLSRFSAPFCLLFFSFAAYGQGSNPFFQPPALPGIPTVVADFNGDGKPDFFASADLTTWLGNGDGTFRQVASGVSLPANTVSSILAADVNGDGKIDLLFVPASSSSTPTTLYVFLGNGDGTFQAAKTTNLGTPLGSPVIADLNGDGKLDLLGTYSGGLLLIAGKGDGTFATGVGVISSPANVLTTGDFNGDGKADIAFASAGSNLTVLLGNGDGTFRAPIASTSVVSPTVMVAGDFNGDGKLDVILWDGNSIFTFLGNGDGTFLAPGPPIPGPNCTTVVGCGGVPHGLAAADVNGDGKLDVVATGFELLIVYLGRGDGTFLANGSYFVGGSGASIVADFNGDGKTDIVFGSDLLIGNGDGSFQGYLVTSAGGGPLSVTGDFNRDGLADIASANGLGISIALSEGTRFPKGPANFFQGPTYTLPGPGQITAIATADLNGDGKLDLVVTLHDPSTQNWSLSVLLGNGDGSFGAPTTIPEGAQATMGAIVVGDFNGDQKPDLAVLNTAQAGSLQVLLGRGDGSFGTPGISSFVGTSPTSLVTADLNGDGKLDAAVAGPSGLVILLGKGDGTFQLPTFQLSSVTQVFAAADFNGDGLMDLLLQDTQETRVYNVLLGNGDGTFGAELSLPITSFDFGPFKAVDVNGDGILDLVAGTGLQVLIGNGDGTFGDPITVFGGSGSSSQFSVPLLAVADFNGDGKPDALLGHGCISCNSVEFVILNTSVPPTPGFVVAASPVAPATVTPGSSGRATITLTSVGGFTDSVALSCSGLPSGVNCSFAPVSLSGSGASVLSITTSPSTPVGTYPVLVVGTSSSLVHERAVNLIVATSVGATTISLAPNLLTFTLQTIGATSPPQTVQLTNTGAAQLTISNISISGANAGDFAQSNDCGASLAVRAHCLVNVTFNGIGARSATVSVIDNATGSPQMVALSGTGPDFSLTAGSTSSATVTPGQTASYTISLAPSAGFNQMITLSCSGAPTRSTCAVSPTSVTLNGAATVNVTVTTTAASSAFGLPTGMGGLGRMNYRSTPILLLLLGVVVLAGLFRWRRELGFRLAPLLTLGLLLWVGLTMTSCGGGSSGSGGGNPGTPAGTYTITVSGTFTSGSTTLTQSTSLTLVVK